MRDTFLDVMSNVAATVTVVTTTGADGEDAGLTVSAFSSVSLDPPLVLVCIGKESSSLDALMANDGYTVNVLTAGSDEIAMRFASRSDDKFSGLDLSRPDVAGAGPVLNEHAFGYFACAIRQRIEAGDHWIILGEVLEAGSQAEPADPLIYHRRRFVRLDQSP